MAEESRIRAARRVRGILLGFPPADRSLIVQLAMAEGKSAGSAEATAKRRGRKPGPKPKGNGHTAPEPVATAGLKKDGTPRKKPGPRKKTEETPAEVAETNAQVDAELGITQEQGGEQPASE